MGEKRFEVVIRDKPAIGCFGVLGFLVVLLVVIVVATDPHDTPAPVAASPPVFHPTPPPGGPVLPTPAGLGQPGAHLPSPPPRLLQLGSPPPPPMNGSSSDAGPDPKELRKDYDKLMNTLTDPNCPGPQCPDPQLRNLGPPAPTTNAKTMWAWSDRCWKLLHQGDLDGADQACDRGLAAPDLDTRVRASLLYNKGLIAERRGDAATAASYYRQSLALRGPNDYGRSEVEAALMRVGR